MRTLQSRKTCFAHCMPTRTVCMWQVDGMVAPLPGSKLLEVSELTSVRGAHHLLRLRRMQSSWFSRLGAGVQDSGFSSTASFCVGSDASVAMRRVGGVGTDAPPSILLPWRACDYVRVHVCDVPPRVSLLLQCSCRPKRTFGVLGACLSCPGQPSRPRGWGGGCSALGLMGVDLEARIALGLTVTV